MVRIKKRELKGRTYYYLEHSTREGKIIHKKEIYLGTKIPLNIEKIKKEFLDDIYRKKWFEDIEKIKKNFIKERKTMSKVIQEKELGIFAIKFTYDTQRIEGSTLSLRETADLLERGIAPKNKPMRDVKEAEAHRDLFYEILKPTKEISLQVILEWHWKLFHSTKSDIAGKIRKHQVAISGSKFLPPPPVEVYPMLADFFRWYNKNHTKLHGVELAAHAHMKFVSIHPFADGNGRVSRLIMNLILSRKGYPMLDIPYEGRTGYYNALERSHLKDDERIFVQWFVKKYIKEHKKYLKA